MSPWMFLAWVAAVAVSMIVAMFAIAAVIVVVRNLAGKPLQTRKLRKTIDAN